MLRGLTTNVYVAEDLAAATEWYATVLGAEPYFDRRPWYVEFRIGDYQHELGILSAEGAKMITKVPAGDGEGDGDRTRPGGAISYWYVDDVEAAYQRLLSLGATEYQPPREFGPGYVGASVLDPFGNVLGVMFNQHYLDVLSHIPAFELPPVEPYVDPAP